MFTTHKNKMYHLQFTASSRKPNVYGQKKQIINIFLREKIEKFFMVGKCILFDNISFIKFTRNACGLVCWFRFGFFPFLNETNTMESFSI